MIANFQMLPLSTSYPVPHQRNQIAVNKIHEFIKQSKTNSPNTDNFNRTCLSSTISVNEIAFNALTDYQVVKDLIFHKKAKHEVPGLINASFSVEDMASHPLVLRNIFMAMGERYQAEAKQVETSAKLSRDDQEKLSEAYKVMVDAFLLSASSIKGLTSQEKLKFGTRHYNGKNFAQRFAQANLIIHSFSTGAGITGFFLSPIPFAGPAGLSLITLAMLNKFSKDIYNRNLGVSLFSIASLAGSAIGPHLANQIWQLLPGIGQAVLAASEGLSAGTMHEAFGWFYFALFESQIKKGQHPHMPTELDGLAQVAAVFVTGANEADGPNRSPEAFSRLIDDLDRRFG